MASIFCDNLSKDYVLKAGPVYRLGHALGMARPAPLQRFGRRLAQVSRGRTLPALHPFSATIEAGESVAVLGRNGSGKSTLLSIIAGVLSPTGGTCRVDGRVAAILELGSGFHPDFSGRANLRVKAALHGLSAAELAAKMDDILSFADIGDFIDEPVSTYSTGMRMRLAFALNTALDPDILFIDEALSVGDTFFQARCIRWIEDFIARGRIFLCVSHDIFTVQKICQRGIVLEKGRTVTDAKIGEAANAYYRVNRGAQGAPRAAPKPARQAAAPAEGDAAWQPVAIRSDHRTGNQAMKVVSVETQPGLEGSFQVGEWLKVRLRMEVVDAVENYHFGFGLRDKRGLLLGGMHTFFAESDGVPLAPGAEVAATFELCLSVPPDDYLLLIGVGETFTESQWTDYDVIWDAAQITVLGPARFWGLSSLSYRDLEITHPATGEEVPH